MGEISKDGRDFSAVLIDEDLYKKIRKAKREWEATADSLNHVILLVDGEGLILRANKAVEKWGLGLVQDVRNLPLHRLLHGACGDPSCYFPDLWAFARENLLAGRSHHCTLEDSFVRRVIKIDFQPISTGREQPADSSFAVVLVEDVSDAVATERQLRQTAAELKAALQAFPDQYLRLEADGTVLDWNSGRGAFLPRDAQFARGTRIDQVFPAETGARFQDAIAAVLRTKSGVKFEYQMPVEGLEQSYEARLSPLLDGQVIVIIRNMTEKLRLESIAQSVEMMNNFGYIFSGIRHEIGNPVNAIKMTMSVLKKNLERFPRTMILEYAERVLTEINRVEYLLKSLRHFNMFEHLKPVKTDVQPFLEDVLALVRQDFEAKGIRIVPPSLPSATSAVFDPRGLHQVLLNILSNAADALENRSDKRIEIGLRRQGDRLELMVTDNGCGLSVEQQSNLFRPFFTSKPHGTGLGLVMVKKLLAQMDGTIDIRSTEGVGTTVALTLPASA